MNGLMFSFWYFFKYHRHEKVQEYKYSCNPRVLPREAKSAAGWRQRQHSFHVAPGHPIHTPQGTISAESSVMIHDCLWWLSDDICYINIFNDGWIFLMTFLKYFSSRLISSTATCQTSPVSREVPLGILVEPSHTNASSKFRPKVLKTFCTRVLPTHNTTTTTTTGSTK